MALLDQGGGSLSKVTSGIRICSLAVRVRDPHSKRVWRVRGGVALGGKLLLIPPQDRVAVKGFVLPEGRNMGQGARQPATPTAFSRRLCTTSKEGAGEPRRGGGDEGSW